MTRSMHITVVVVLITLTLLTVIWQMSLDHTVDKEGQRCIANGGTALVQGRCAIVVYL